MSTARAKPPTKIALAQAAALAGVHCWVVKSEPFVYSFDQLLADARRAELLEQATSLF